MKDLSENSDSSLKTLDFRIDDDDPIDDNNTTNKQIISNDSNILLDYDSFLEYSIKVDNGIMQDDIVDKTKCTNEKYEKIEKKCQLLERIIYSLTDELNIDEVIINKNIKDLNELSSNNLIDLLKSAIKNSNHNISVNHNNINNNTNYFHKAYSSEWEEIIEWNPVPPFNLQSPVIQHLLNTWTTDQNKIDYLHGWIRSLSQEDTAHKYPPGIQITSISNVLRDGIMLLLLPLIREASLHNLSIFTRKHELFQSQQLSSSPSRSLSKSNDNEIDNEILINQPITDGPYKSTTISVNRKSLDESEVCNTDPFAHIGDIVYDVRIIRTSYISSRMNISNDPQSQHHHMMMMFLENDDGILDNNKQYHRPSSSIRYKSDEQNYYSQLSEINKFLPVIEAQMEKDINHDGRDSDESRISNTTDSISNHNHTTTTNATATNITTPNKLFLDFLPATWTSWFGNSTNDITINNNNNNDDDIVKYESKSLIHDNINNMNMTNSYKETAHNDNFDRHIKDIRMKDDIISPVNKIKEKLNRIRMKSSNIDRNFINQSNDQVEKINTNYNNTITTHNNDNTDNNTNNNSDYNTITNIITSDCNNLNDLPSIEEILQVYEYTNEHESVVLEASL